MVIVRAVMCFSEQEKAGIDGVAIFPEVNSQRNSSGHMCPGMSDKTLPIYDGRQNRLVRSWVPNIPGESSLGGGKRANEPKRPTRGVK